MPVPPVVNTKRAPSSAWRAMASLIAPRSSLTTSWMVSSPACSHSPTRAGPERSSPSPRAIVVEMVRTAASTRGSLVSLDVMPEQIPDVAFVLEAFRAFEVQAGTLEEYYERFWAPDGVIELVDGFPVTGSYHGLEGYRRGVAGPYGPYGGRGGPPRAG